MPFKARPPYFPGDQAFAVTPSDTTLITGSAENGARIYVGVTGDVYVDMALSGTDIKFTAVPAGTTLNIAAIRVKAATTAQDVVAFW